MRFFVYDLIDPRSGETFYVGKGCGNRPQQHMAEARAGKKSKKCRLIREIESAGERVNVRIVSRHEVEEDAYAHEVERIAEIGLENLTNVLPGGRGGRMARDLSIAQQIPKAVALSVAKVIYMGQNGLRVKWGGIDLGELAAAYVERLIDKLGMGAVSERFEAVGVLLTERNNAVC